MEDLEQKAIDPTKPNTCYFAKLDGFVEISKLSAGTQFHLRNQNNFTIEPFVKKIAIPLIKDLINEVKAAFQIPECLVGVTYFYPQCLPSEATEKLLVLKKSKDWQIFIAIQYNKIKNFSIHSLIRLPR